MQQEEFYYCVEINCPIKQRFFADNQTLRQHSRNKCDIEDFTEIRTKIINSESRISRLIEFYSFEQLLNRINQWKEDMIKLFQNLLENEVTLMIKFVQDILPMDDLKFAYKAVQELDRDFIMNNQELIMKLLNPSDKLNQQAELIELQFCQLEGLREKLLNIEWTKEQFTKQNSQIQSQKESKLILKTPNIEVLVKDYQILQEKDPKQKQEIRPQLEKEENNSKLITSEKDLKQKQEIKSQVQNQENREIFNSQIIKTFQNFNFESFQWFFKPEKQEIHNSQIYQTPQESNFVSDQNLSEGGFRNYQFFMGLIPCSCNMTIDEILSMKGNYEFFKHSKKFIQWLFPNFFQSQFNENSQPLSFPELKKFISGNAFQSDEQIFLLFKYLDGYSIFLNYFGIQENQGQLVLFDKERLKFSIMDYQYDRLAIARILTSLHTFGFHDRAFELCRILKQEYKEIYEQKFKFYDREEWKKNDQYLVSTDMPNRQEILKFIKQHQTQ